MPTTDRIIYHWSGSDLQLAVYRVQKETPRMLYVMREGGSGWWDKYRLAKCNLNKREWNGSGYYESVDILLDVMRDSKVKAEAGHETRLANFYAGMSVLAEQSLKEKAA